MPKIPAKLLVALPLGPSRPSVGTPAGPRPIDANHWRPSIENFESCGAKVRHDGSESATRIDLPPSRSQRSGVCDVSWKKNGWFDVTLTRPRGIVRQSALVTTDPGQEAYDIQVNHFLPLPLDKNRGLDLPHRLLKDLVASSLSFYETLGGRRLSLVQAGLWRKVNPFDYLEHSVYLCVDIPALKKIDPEFSPIAGVGFFVRLQIDWNSVTKQWGVLFQFWQGGNYRNATEIPERMRRAAFEVIEQNDRTLYAPPKAGRGWFLDFLQNLSR